MSRILVVGAYGMIGAAITRHLIEAGHHVTGLGRSILTARQAFPGLDWYIHDMAHMTVPSDWLPYLRDIDVVVNAAGALQDGPSDDLTAVHATSVAALAEACATHNTALVQISSIGVRPDATTHFFRSKAAGDAAVRTSGAKHWVLRPGLVLASTAYGATGLLRMLGAVPLVQPLAMGGIPIQTIGTRDIGRAVEACIRGDIPSGTEADLVEDSPHSLGEITASLRSWLGFAPANRTINAPKWLLKLTSFGADLLGRLGWRSPLRSNALTALSDEVVGDPEPWRAAGGFPIASLGETLARMPARSEDRLAARARLVMPFVVGTLALFWVLSGLIGLAQLDFAAGTLLEAGWPLWAAQLSVAAWALVDIGLAAALLWRPTAQKAALGMVLVSLVYLGLGTVITPWLWADPLGPLLKILPGMMLAVVALPLLESR
ncbi:SDR family oxidoreductase [Alisedimentitalea sp. MJ-SS2]|uniref:SDR family oxidoreductase n=1 Tax=Aliisedimentitalea sp. MJ-SS2 TaxID=3049795 RepID=UPI00290CDC6B|nr:SDR family oxidoreductase [Alisedimentitalea sp. MJ-SS2]MDU8928657.1 SDR family oxidoreductase [Alisedimentitalea sp. MJ-SS2]